MKRSFVINSSAHFELSLRDFNYFIDSLSWNYVIRIEYENLFTWFFANECLVGYIVEI